MMVFVNCWWLCLLMLTRIALRYCSHNVEETTTTTTNSRTWRKGKGEKIDNFVNKYKCKQSETGSQIKSSFSSTPFQTPQLLEDTKHTHTHTHTRTHRGFFRICFTNISSPPHTAHEAGASHDDEEESGDDAETEEPLPDLAQCKEDFFSLISFYFFTFTLQLNFILLFIFFGFFFKKKKKKKVATWTALDVSHWIATLEAPLNKYRSAFHKQVLCNKNIHTLMQSGKTLLAREVVILIN